MFESIVVCRREFTPDGRPATSTAKVALGKLEDRGLVGLPPRAKRSKGRHRLVRSNQPLPALVGVPGRVDQIQGLRLHLIDGAKDPLQGLWNDLIVEQHPCGDAPLVGAQLGHLRQVVGMSRLLIRQEVRCANLESKVLSLVLGRSPEDWQQRYGIGVWARWAGWIWGIGGARDGR
jgi:hypothetical protein